MQVVDGRERGEGVVTYGTRKRPRQQDGKEGATRQSIMKLKHKYAYKSAVQWVRQAKCGVAVGNGKAAATTQGGVRSADDSSRSTQTIVAADWWGQVSRSCATAVPHKTTPAPACTLASPLGPCVHSECFLSFTKLQLLDTRGLALCGRINK
jgi:hypothetical protein